jgi:hypothetical protein
MGKKEYEHAAKHVREYRDAHNPNDQTERIAHHMEQAFVSLFNTFDSKGRFDQTRFLAACRKK